MTGVGSERTPTGASGPLVLPRTQRTPGIERLVRPVATEALMRWIFVTWVLRTAGLWLYGAAATFYGLLASTDARFDRISSAEELANVAAPATALIVGRPLIGWIQWQLERELRRRELAAAHDRAPVYSEPAPRSRWIYAALLAMAGAAMIAVWLL